MTFSKFPSGCAKKYLCAERKLFYEYSKWYGKLSLADNAVKSTSFTAFPLMSKRYKVQKGSGYFSIFLSYS